MQSVIAETEDDSSKMVVVVVAVRGCMPSIDLGPEQRCRSKRKTMPAVTREPRLRCGLYGLGVEVDGDGRMLEQSTSLIKSKKEIP